MGCAQTSDEKAATAKDGGPGNEEGDPIDQGAIDEFTGGKRMVIDPKTGEAKIGDAVEEKCKEGGIFDEEKIEAGEQFGAVRPYEGALIEPTKHLSWNPSEPDVNYVLEYVYGYRTYDCRQNLYFTSNGKVVFNVAALGIILDPKTNTQTFFGGGTLTATNRKIIGHDNDIICLSISPDRKYAATGQVGAKPSLYIWDTETGKMKNPKSIYTIKEKNTRAIAACGWSSDGKYVVFTDKGEKKAIYVINSDTGEQVMKDPGQNNDVFAVAWSKASGEEIFATCGKRHITFWNLKTKKGQSGVGHGGQTFTCASFDDKGICYAGGFDGNIYIFVNRSVTKKIPAHKGVIHSLVWSEGKIISGGQDKNICVFDSDHKELLKVPVGHIPRSLDRQGDDILVGLNNGTICIVSEAEKKVKSTLMRSHHDGEVWGLEVIGNEIFTTGDDNKLMQWDCIDRTNKGVFPLNEKPGEKIKYGASSMTNMPDNQCSRAICYNEKTSEIAVATNSGDVQIREFTNPDKVKKTLKAAKRWIEFMAYSPDGNYLAVATHDQSIVVYDTAEYKSKGELKDHKSAITSLDWSKDSKYIRSNCMAYELLFFTVDDMKQDKSGASNTKDLEWATCRNKITWETIGVFPKGCGGNYVNGVDMSVDGKFIATGDNGRMVNIYNNPCREGSKCKSFVGHSEHVVRVKFGSNDERIFSVGGQDKTLMQWKKQ